MSFYEINSKANQLFIENKYKQAIIEYENALKVAVSDRDRSICLTNRSMAYFELKGINNALRDAKQAVEIDPSYLGAQIILSKAYVLSDPRSAATIIESIRKSGKLDAIYNKTYVDIWKAYIDNYFKSKNSASFFNVKYIDSNFGRGVFSNKSFKSQILIFEEIPLVSHCRLDLNSNIDMCGYCMKSFLKAENLGIYSSQLKLIYEKRPYKWYRAAWETEATSLDPYVVGSEKFCSIDCLNNAEAQYYSLLSPLAPFLDKSIPNPVGKLIKICQSFTPPLINPLLILRIFASIILKISGGTQSFSYEELLQSKINAMEPYTLFQIKEGIDKELAETTLDTIRSIYTLKYKEMPNFIEFLDSFINQELYHHLNGVIQRNAHHLNPVSDFHLYLNEISPERQSIMASMYKKGMSPMEFVQSPFVSGLTVHGTGLFEITNSMNHSCIPNIAIVQAKNSHCLSWLSLREIEKGEELTISYIDEDLPLSDRKALLKSNYDFECKCNKCIEQENRLSSRKY